MIKFIVLHKTGGTFTVYRSIDELMQHFGKIFKYLRDRELIIQRDDQAYVMERIPSNPIEIQKEINQIIRYFQ